MLRFSTGSDRLEAFSDAVLAVIITIMVLDLKLPPGPDIRALRSTIPTVAAYALSFLFIGIYWNNHHHMLRAARGINGKAMWLNLHLLFWLSLIPFASRWLGTYPSSPGPAAVYAALLFICPVAYLLLQRELIFLNGSDSAFAKAIRSDVKGKVTLAICAVATGAAFLSPWICDAMLAVAALIWFIPDRRMEAVIDEQSGQHPSEAVDRQGDAVTGGGPIART